MKDYIFSNDFSRNLDARIYTCGYETCAPSHSYGPVVRSGYLIHYILKGKGIYNENGTKREICAGDVTFCPDGEGHGLVNDGDEDIIFIALILKKK